MKNPQNIRRCGRGFTLIELLVVITIIAILVGIAFPVYNKILEKANKTSALATMQQVRGALTSYWNEYSDWPQAFLVGVAVTDDARIDAETGSTPPSPGKWGSIYKTLIAKGDDEFLKVNNKRRLPFMEFPPKILDNKSDPTLATTFLDPWGREFNIVIDTNGDNKIENLPNTKTGTKDLTINGTMALWSYGSDPSDVRNYVVSRK